MKNHRVLPLVLLATAVLCFALIAFPWQSAGPIGNFSGKMVFRGAEGSHDLSGRFNLYNLVRPVSDVRVVLVWAGGSQEVNADAVDGTFSGSFQCSAASAASMEARLVVDGQVVARSVIELPAEGNGVHIIRFSSVS